MSSTKDEIILLDAIIAWRNWLLTKDVLRKSRSDYLSNMSKLIENGIIDVEQPLREFIKEKEDKFRLIIQNVEWTYRTKKARGDILQKFCKFTHQADIKPSKINISFKDSRYHQQKAIKEILSSNELKAQSSALSTEDVIKFIKELGKINSRDALICWMMWELRATIHQILDLTVKDVDFNRGAVNLREENLIQLGEALKECISMLYKNSINSDLLFCTERGQRIHAGQIIRNMRKASLRAELPLMISPTILFAHSVAYSKNRLQEITLLRFEKLFSWHCKTEKNKGCKTEKLSLTTARN
jgi:integrase